MDYIKLIGKFVLVAGITTMCAAQGNSNIEMVKDNKHNDHISMVRVSPSHQIQATDEGKSWLKEVLGFGEKDNFKLMSVEKDKIGMTHYRLQQTHASFPVEGTMYIVHTRDGKIESANGEYAKRFSTSESPSVAEASALTSALAHVGAGSYKWEIDLEEQHLKQITGDNSATYYPQGELVYKQDEKHRIYVLCYKFDVYAHKPISRDFVYVNAESGEVLSTTPRIHYADSVGIGASRYSGNVSITTNYTGSAFQLTESGRGSGIHTLDLQNGTNYASAANFSHTTNTWDSLGTDDDLAVDAHFGAEATYDFLLNVHGRNSIDGNGMALYSYVHYDNNFANAFWDGQRMTYGDGDANIKALVSVEICGHEIGHGLQQFTAQFSQNGESGALGESFSDIMGTLVEAYKFPGRSDSLIYNTGDQVMNNSIGLRNYIDPKLTSNPNTYLGTNYDASNTDVHNNGVVHDHWFYILSEGLSGVNDNSDIFNVTGIGRDKAGDIAMRSLMVYMTPTAGYNEARKYSIEAAKDLYGPCSNEVIQTTNAWYAVGVGNEYSAVLAAGFTFDMDICKEPKEVRFNNSSTGALQYLWDFGDGTTGIASNPTHAYPVDGSYTVKLVASGCDMVSTDSIIKSNAFIIDNNLNCDSANMPLSGDISSDNCYGMLYDHGGKNGDVVPHTNSTFTISPSNAANVSVSFNSFDYSGFLDQIVIYDGADANSLILATFDLFRMPGDTVLTSSSGSITIKESTGLVFPGFPAGTGFEMKWTCTQNPSGINNQISSSDVDVYPNPGNGRFHIRNNSSQSIDKIEVLNMMGQTVYYEQFNIPNSKNVIDFNINTSQSNGIFVLSMYSGENKMTKKIFINQ